MISCSEFILDDLLAITAIPIENIRTDSADSPALRLMKAISYDFSTCYNSGTTVIGRTPVTQEIPGKTEPYVSSLIPIKRFTGKARDEESDSVAGRLHTVKVTCEVDDRDSGVWDLLLALERTACHLLLTFRDGTTKGFVSATEDTYLCEVERDGAKTSVQFRVQNLMGIQLLI